MKVSFFRKYILIIIVLCCGLGSSALLINAIKNPNKILEIVFLDVGQGDTTLIRTPQGRNIIIDTGPKNNLGEKLAPYIPMYDRTIDLLILTHPDLDHIGGTLSILKNYKVKKVVHSGLLAGASMYKAVAARVDGLDIPATEVLVGQVIQLDKDVYLEIYNPTPTTESFEPNDYSIVTRLIYRNSSVLLTGDASTLVEHDITDIYNTNIVSNILKIGHHGSKTSTGDFFLEIVQPEIAIISAGCNNRFGHPHPDVLARLFIHKIEVFDTCNNGDIAFESNGEEWVKI